MINLKKKIAFAEGAEKVYKKKINVQKLFKSICN